LVMIVPASNPAHLTSVTGITAPGVKVVICAASVPCGDYARNVFKNLGITSAAMANVVSNASDVSQVVAQVALGQADAGFVYVTDATAAGGKVVEIPLPDAAKPNASDYIAVVTSGPHQPSAKAFVADVLSPRGQAILRAAGFGVP
jgi:molybdate transport system substrate-binding protein